jgi:hypothetical protein
MVIDWDGTPQAQEIDREIDKAIHGRIEDEEDAIALLNNTLGDDGEPEWWVIQRLPGRIPEEQYGCLIGGLTDHALAPTLRLAVCRAWLIRKAVKESNA